MGFDRAPARGKHVHREAARPQYPRYLRERTPRIEHMLHHRGRVDEVEIPVCEGDLVVRRLDAAEELRLYRTFFVGPELLVDPPRGLIAALEELRHVAA